MTKTQQRGDGWTTAMRWAARLLGLVAVGLFVFFVVESGGEVLPALSLGSPQGIPLLVALLAALAGLILAWRWEMFGGLMAVVSAAIIFGLVCLGSGLDMSLCAFYFTLPLFLSGVLYLGSFWRTREVTIQ
jgi:hypothetical protein